MNLAVIGPESVLSPGAFWCPRYYSVFDRPDLDPCTLSMTINGLDPRLGYEAHRNIWVILNKIILTYN